MKNVITSEMPTTKSKECLLFGRFFVDEIKN